MHFLHKLKKIVLGSSLCLFIDQYSKYWVRNSFPQGQSLAVNPFFNIISVWNSGISFGVFPCRSPIGRFFLMGVIVAFIFLLVHWYVKTSETLQEYALICIVGGAFSNLYDRLRFTAVFDFIQLHYEGWYFPVFNLADMLIAVGFLALFLGNIPSKKLKP